MHARLRSVLASQPPQNSPGFSTSKLNVVSELITIRINRGRDDFSIRAVRNRHLIILSRIFDQKPYFPIAELNALSRSGERDLGLDTPAAGLTLVALRALSAAARFWSSMERALF